MNSSPEPVKPSSSPASSRLRLVALAALALGIVLLAAGAVFWLRPQGPTPVANSGVIQVAKGAAMGGPFELVDHNGQAVSQADFAGKFMLIYFGFTHCPDVCPTELQTMANAVDMLGPDAERVAPTFITVDPARDTPGQIKDYVAAFHPKMVGLTGSPEQIAAVAKAYKVYYSKAQSPSDSGDYQVDHTSFVYLMGPDGGLRSLFRSGISDKAMATEIRNQLRQSS
jgi:cytochrome oxidase Cu insertion factor (SCO1/SenC/PrrC family)